MDIRPHLAWTPLGSQPHWLLPYLSLHFELTPASGGPHLVTADDYLHPNLRELSREQTTPWLLARPVGRELLIGPLFRPGEAPCWSCLAHWIATNRPQLSASARDDQGIYLPQTETIEESFAISILGQALTRLAAGDTPPSITGALLIFGTGNKPKQAVVHRRPYCECCPQPNAQPMSLMSWVNPITGIVPAVEVGSDLIGGLYQARCQFMRPLPRMGARPHLLPGDAWGSGPTPEQAAESCVREAIERYCSIWQGTEPERLTSIHSLTSIVHPRELLHFSETQYRTRSNVPPDGFHWVPSPFFDEQECAWVEATCILDKTLKVQIPAAIAYLWRTYTHDTFAIADSNGCAMGSTLEDAQYRAALELIERDAVAIWWYNRLERPRIDPGLLEDPLIDEGTSTLRRISEEPIFLDLTNDLGIPVIACLAYRGDQAAPFFGAAADPDPRRAARRAMSEMIQFRVWSEYSIPDDATEAPPYLVGRPGGSLPESANHIVDVASLANSLASRKLNAYWLNLTRPEIGLPVVRVIIPGLRHAWKRLAPGRLYDVPVSLGWLDRPKTESEMNPIGCPL